MTALLADTTDRIPHRVPHRVTPTGGADSAVVDDALEQGRYTQWVQGPAGERRIAAKDFFTGLYATALAANEIIVACDFPVSSAHERFAFDELTRRHGDYAVVGLAACAVLISGVLSQVRLAWLGVGTQPARTTEVEQILEGQFFSNALLASATQALRRELQPQADLTHSAATKQHLAEVMLKRALIALTGTAL